jgi:hypothetical protein
MNGIPQPPAGPMRTAQYVAEHHFSGEVSPEWVLEHVRPRVELSRTKVRFYDDDVIAWIASRRTGAAA